MEVNGRRITVIGVGPDGLEGLSIRVRRCIETAALVVAGPDGAAALKAAGIVPDRLIDFSNGLDFVLSAISQTSGDACVLASGDPGYFGIGRALAKAFGPRALEVVPAPSSVAVAFARLSLPWDDALVVSVHGRDPVPALTTALRAEKVAILTGPATPPQAVAAWLLDHGARFDRVVVATRLGESEEDIYCGTLSEVAGGSFDPRSVVIALSGSGISSKPVSVAIGGHSDQPFRHRDSMITKDEVRAVALAKLDLPTARTLWDVGAGSGSVGIEAAQLVPGLKVVAVEREPSQCALIRANAAARGVDIEIVEGVAPAAFDLMSAPDRIFVGGGGTEVLMAAWQMLAGGGRLVATFAALERAVGAAHLLGEIVQIQASPGRRLPDGSWRLVGANPVFLAWGRKPA